MALQCHEVNIAPSIITHSSSIFFKRFFIQASYKDNIKEPYYVPFVHEIQLLQWIPLTNREMLEAFLCHDVIQNRWWFNKINRLGLFRFFQTRYMYIFISFHNHIVTFTNWDNELCRLCLINNPYHSHYFPWWRHQMEIFSALLAICAGNSPVPGEFPAQRPVTRSFDVFFDLRRIKRLNKQSWGWWFETLSHPLRRHSNEKCPCCTLSWAKVSFDNQNPYENRYLCINDDKISRIINIVQFSINYQTYDL